MEIIPFKYQGKHSIAFCIVDNTKMATSGWGREIMVNLTDQLLYQIYSRGYDIYIDSSEDLLLQTISNKDEYNHVVMIAAGTSLKLNEKLFEAIELLCKTNFSIAGHILDRKESYYELHHQFYIINIHDYRQIGLPSLGKEYTEQHTQIEPIRSYENVHDDYVPLWIKQGTALKTYEKKMHGWNLLSKLLEHDKAIIDIGRNIRNSKRYFYYEYDHVFVKELPELYYNMFFGTNFVPAHNSDAIRSVIEFTGPVDQYITVGTGYNWIKNLEIIGYTDNTVVTFTDVNPNCITFMQLMIEKWDGKDYGSFYKDFIKTKVPNGPIEVPESYYIDAQRNWEAFKLLFEDWDNMWASIKKIKYQFSLVNYLALYNLDFINPGYNIIFNVSDLFNYTPMAFSASLKYRLACENRLITELKNKDPNITLMFTARAATGFSNSSLKYIGCVNDFEETDINNLTTPPWHTEDWKSPRILR